MNLVARIFTKFSQWKDSRFLKKHGCVSWEQYHWRNDPGILYRASTVKDYYRGYPFVHCFERREHHAYQSIYDHGPGDFRDGIHEIKEWCDQYCQGKFRIECHRVIKGDGLGLDGSVSDEWWFNEIAGGDYYFAAFKDARDLTWFMMKWS